MAVKVLGRLAAGLAAAAPAPVFAAVGPGVRDRVEALARRPGIRLVASPRHATVLLVTGGIPGRLDEALARVHDQLSHPRATVRWGTGADPEGFTPAGGATRVVVDDDPVPAIRRLHEGLVRGDHATEPHRLPDEPPHPWRGRGDHGQGGQGMMGGTPYGRPMAMTGPDVRDGLALDRLELRLGPFFPPLPPGLVLDLTLQGDVVQEAEVVETPFPQPLPEPLGGALRQPVDAAEMEVARARVLLRRVARVLRPAGAEALAERALALAVAERPTSAAAGHLRALAHRGGALRALPDVGLEGGPGPRTLVARWLESAGEALATHESGGDGRGGSAGPVDELAEQGEPFGTGGTAVLDRLPHALVGMEWGEAMLLVAALDPVPVSGPDGVGA